MLVSCVDNAPDRLSIPEFFMIYHLDVLQYLFVELMRVVIILDSGQTLFAMNQLESQTRK